MEWHITEALTLSAVDYAIGEHRFSPAEYEIIRQVIVATADGEFKELIKFSEQSLQAGAAALAARLPIVADSAPVSASITAIARDTFANLVFCAEEVVVRSSTSKSPVAQGLESLAQRYPEAFFVIGSYESALVELLTLVEKEEIKPSFVIAVPPCMVTVNDLKQRLVSSTIPHIRCEGAKGGCAVAVGIFKGLAELAWQAYGELPLG
jgi:precorrin-8X/cobalt-precorrin-8 methylmutase